VVEKGQGCLRSTLPSHCVLSGNYNKMIALMGSVTRLRAEVYGKSLEFRPRSRPIPTSCVTSVNRSRRKDMRWSKASRVWSAASR